MKKFIVRCCYECPFLRCDGNSMLYCMEKFVLDELNYPEKTYQIEDGTELPEWCPLEDLEDDTQ